MLNLAPEKVDQLFAENDADELRNAISGEQWMSLIHELGATFEQRDIAHDQDDSFVSDIYADLKDYGLFSAAIPTELGGDGLTHAEIANVLRVLAQYSSSTALANSMHQHLVAANIWKYKKGKGGEEMLRKVVAQHPVLISTGAKDWLESNGQKVVIW